MRRTVAIVTGFLGVLLIVRPTPSTFTIYELLALGIVFILAFRDLITKRIPAHIPTFIIALANAFIRCPRRHHLWLLPGLSRGGAMAIRPALRRRQSCWLRAMCSWWPRCASAIFQAPRLSVISDVLFAIILGMVFFGEFPDALSYAGMGLIIAAGLYAAHREAVLGKAVKQPL